MRKIITAAIALTLASGASAAPEPVDPPARQGSMAHRPVPDGDGALLTWLEPVGAGGAYALRLSRFDGRAWSEPVTIREGDDFFANWADVPSVRRLADGSLAASWLQRSGEGTYAYDLMLARSEDEGGVWRELGPAHDDGVQAEHGFVAMTPEGEDLRLFWLDGRTMGGGERGGGGEGGHGVHGALGRGSMTMRTARLTPGGEVVDSIMLDPRTCECCTTDSAMTPDGPVVVYRDRSATEVRDISIVRAEGDSWSAPALVAADNWRIPACPVNGPAIDARAGEVAVAWHTGAGGGRVQVAFSDSGGKRFGEPVLLATRGDESDPVGRVDVALLDSGEALVTWLAAGGEVFARRVGSDGSMRPVRTLAMTSASRAAGFPKLVALDDARLLLTWTEVTEERGTRVRAAVVTP